MYTSVRFYKTLTGLWYADLPEYIAAGGSVESCLMVSGADQLLEFLADEGKDEVTLAISDEPFTGATHLFRINEPFNKIMQAGDDFDLEELNTGAWYRMREYRGLAVGHDLWLCPVTLFVFGGEYPNSIYFKKLS